MFLKRYFSVAPRPAPHGAQCPICGSTAFQPYSGREKAQCVRCKSLERSRLLWIVLQRSGALKESPQRVLHIAPELCFMKEFHKRYGAGYRPADIDPDNYRNRICKVEGIDLCTDLEYFEDASFDLIVHNHVLEHIPCDVAGALRELNRMLAPGGLHLFSVPFRRGPTRENLSPDLPAGERIRQFGQIDHLRMFGTDDFPAFLEEHFSGGFARIDPLSMMSAEEIARAGIQLESVDRLDGNSIFSFKKPL